MSVRCGRLPGVLDVDVENGVAVITATVKSLPGGDCDALCGAVTQTITLAEPLPHGVRFEAPDDADPRCGP
jgi:hypothetical protein